MCFDDFYPDSRFASLMTVASQSPYDIGVNAAQLLLNRLDGNNHLQARTIILPPRLIIRQSCGGDPSSIIDQDTYHNVQGHLILSLPQNQLLSLAAEIDTSIQVSTLTSDERQQYVDSILAYVPKHTSYRNTFDFVVSFTL